MKHMIQEYEAYMKLFLNTYDSQTIYMKNNSTGSQFTIQNRYKSLKFHQIAHIKLDQ